MTKSRAKITFDRNWENINDMLDVLISASKNAFESLEKLKAMKGVPSDEFDRTFEDLQKLHAKQVSTARFLYQWSVVMIVTFTETYLQDILAEAAKVDPDLIKDARLSATYDEILSSDSVEELALAVRRRWASRNFVDSGPTKWIERLRQMGASNLIPELTAPLERFWGLRHCVVHNAGIVTAEFVRIHNALDLAVGTPITLTGDEMHAYSLHVLAFVEQADAYFIKRFPTLVL